MRVKIYQINSDRDTERKHFMATEDGTVDPSIYDEVFNAEIDETDLEGIFTKFNTEGHPLHRGYSLSVSDVVCLKDKAYVVEPIGFKEVDFDESKTQKQDNLMRVVYVEPGKPAYVAEVEHTLEGEQRAVKGYIEAIYLDDDDDAFFGRQGFEQAIQRIRQPKGFISKLLKSKLQYEIYNWNTYDCIVK